jgi:transposase
LRFVECLQRDGLDVATFARRNRDPGHGVLVWGIDHKHRVKDVLGHLADLSQDFQGLYAQTGGPSIAPEKLLRALLLQAFYSIRSERQLMKQLDFNLLYRWFDAERPLRTVGLSIDDVVGDARVFCKNRDRLPPGNVAQRFLDAVLSDTHVCAVLCADHFSVDGTSIEARPSMCPQIP